MIIVKIITKRDNFALFASFRCLRPDVSEVVMDRVLGYRNICGTIISLTLNLSKTEKDNMFRLYSFVIFMLVFTKQRYRRKVVSTEDFLGA